jgi:hypothetical protein
MTMSFNDRIGNLIESGFQIIFVPTTERSRCEAELERVSIKHDMEFMTWDAVSGLSTDAALKDPLEMLTALDEDVDGRFKNKDILFVLRNLHVFLEDPSVRQSVQNLYYGRKLSSASHRRPIVILSNVMQINDEISNCVTLAEFTLPTEPQLTAVFTDVTGNIEVDESRPGAIATYDEDHKKRIVQAMRGLTAVEAENILAYGLRVNRGFSPGLIDTIEDQKATALQKSEVLTYVPKDKIASMDDIGGYEELKEFINVRSLAYTPKAREIGIDLPRGICLLGIPGTGKSFVGKVLARALNQPLVTLDVASAFGSLVGQSEQRIKAALRTIDALDGAVVLIDEAEKALAGANQSSTGDSGVTQRVFGQILTWLTEKKSATFVVMTMNRTRGIPPEFLRKGRLTCNVKPT